MMTCIFCKIIDKKIPATIVHENERLIAFNDIHPQAPTHILIIPKAHIPTLNDITDSDTHLLGEMIVTAKKLAHEQGLSENGYRLNFNTNKGGGQEVYHIHLHLLGGRQMTWPPG